jgi:hypothetical protein
VKSTDSVTLHFHAGRQSQSFLLHQPSGTIQLYRIEAPRGANVRAFTEIPKVTAPLLNATGPVEPTSACKTTGSRIRCTVGEEGCPMPDAIWHVRVDKLAGPAGDITVTFRVGAKPLR